MPELDGSGQTVDLAPGYRISAPGLRGTATANNLTTVQNRSPGPEGATSSLLQALQAGNLVDIMTVELEVQSVAPPPTAPSVRTSQGDDALVLEVPDLGDQRGQVVLAIDEDGAVSWNFPTDVAGNLETPATRGPGGYKRFVIRRHVLAAPPAPPSRGLFSLVGRKILKVLVYPVADAVLGPISEFFAGLWEERYRPYRLRMFGPGDYQSPDADDISDQGWGNLSSGRGLLFLHGTFSRAHSGFGGLPPETMRSLFQSYGGRVFAFDHYTLSQGPDENARWFLSRIPQDVALDIDLICHSRGGLVARSLIKAVQEEQNRRVAVRRVVFVATPNHGTSLVVPDNLISLIDRYTSILNLMPPGPPSAVADVLETIIAVVKVVGHGVLHGLDGLYAMNPNGNFLQSLAGGGPPDAQFYAVSANYEPEGGLRDLVRYTGDWLLDRVFQNAANDLIVPTEGVFKGSNTSGFPISPDRVLMFDTNQGVSHSRYFSQPETSASLKSWLGVSG